MKNVAVVLAAGKGSRMKSDIPKQFMELDGKPLVCHCLEVFQQSSHIDDIVVVTGEEQISYVKEEICDAFGYGKVRAVVAGGKERCHSVNNALQYISEQIPDCVYVFIHDGARPFLTEELVGRLCISVQEEGACIAAVPVKDTIKVADAEGHIQNTPARTTLWAAQTPQVFSFPLIRNAYARMIQEDRTENITDDAQVLERMEGYPVKLVEGSYGNRKITTPEDIQ